MDELIAIIGIIAVFGTITAIIVGPTYFKMRERRETQETVRRAIEKGQPLPPEVIEAMSQDVTKSLPSRSRDIRRGIIWLAIGIGLAAFTLVKNSTGAEWGGHNFNSGVLGLACIPATIGLAFIVLSFFNPNKD